nr:hypothetical protein [Sinorhizobium sp. LM21]
MITRGLYLVAGMTLQSWIFTPDQIGWLDLVLTVAILLALVFDWIERPSV